MNEQQFKEISQTISQIGFYLMNLGDLSLFNDTPTHRNIVALLLQMSLKLNETIKGNRLLISDVTSAPTTATKCEKYITKQQVIEMCHPLITQYAINEAIRTNDIPYIKRGNKYFFLEVEVKEWIEKKRSDSSVRSNHKYV